MQWLQLDSVPPSTVEDLVAVRGQLVRLEVLRAGVDDLSCLLGRPSAHTSRRLRAFRRNYLLDNAAKAHATKGGAAGGAVTFVLPLDDFLETRGAKHVNPLWCNLLFLRLHNCGLTHFDSSLCLLPFVKQLDMSSNSMSSFKHLSGCLNLRVANFSSNRFTSLAKLGSEVSNIQRLNLSRNRIQWLRGVEHLPWLEALDMSHNLISHVDQVKHLLGLHRLNDLVLAGNPVASLFASSLTAEGGALGLEHRHPMWETLAQHQARVWSSGRAQRSLRLEEDSRPRRPEGSLHLYRLMVFAYFYPQLSSNGHYRSREMVILDGEAISDIENEIVK